MRRHSDARELESWIDSGQLLALITEALKNEPAFRIDPRSRRIGLVVDVDDGYVTLVGIVRSIQDRRLAEIIARAHRAIGVDNQLRLLDDVQPDN